LSQVILNASAHHQVLNAYHLHPHKWPENPPFTADQIRSATDENHQLSPKSKTLSNLRSFISWLNNDSHDEEDNKSNH
jgi:hypothetical protein